MIKNIPQGYCCAGQVRLVRRVWFYRGDMPQACPTYAQVATVMRSHSTLTSLGVLLGGKVRLAGKGMDIPEGYCRGGIANI
jgi:hypothetical protein